MSLRRMKIFHKKWRDAHDKWHEQIQEMQDQQDEARKMLRHIESLLEMHKEDMLDFLNKLDQHEKIMEDHEKEYDHLMGEEHDDTRSVVTMRDHFGQVERHESYRQEYLQIQKRHQYLYKLLKRLNDSLDD